VAGLTDVENPGEARLCFLIDPQINLGAKQPRPHVAAGTSYRGVWVRGRVLGEDDGDRLIAVSFVRLALSQPYLPQFGVSLTVLS